MALPQGKTEREYSKFIETTDGKIALRVKVHSDSLVTLEAYFVKKTGDTMSGTLVLTPGVGEKSLEANADIAVKQDCKIYLDAP